MHYFLGMEVWTREVCSTDPEEVQDDRLQGDGPTYGIEPEAIECCFIRVSLCHDVSSDYLFLDVPNDMRPDICFAMNTLRHVHPMVAKHAVRYLKGIVDHGLKYKSDQKINLEGYVCSEDFSSLQEQEWLPLFLQEQGQVSTVGKRGK